MHAIDPHSASFRTFLSSPVGFCTITADSDHILSISLVDDPPKYLKRENPLTQACHTQLQAYFGGDLKVFDLPLKTSSYTPFQQSVWAQLLTIPFGKTAFYSDLAHALDNPKAVRAVGLANGKNPFTIVVPCHRIIGKDNSMTGYAHGVDKKRWLLEHEGAIRKELKLF